MATSLTAAFVVPNHIAGRGSPDEEVSEYIIDSALAKGAFGDVILVRRRVDQVLFVAKYMFLAKLREEDRVRAENEIRCMKRLHHFACVGLVNSFKVGETCVLILEYMDAGDLLRHLEQYRRAGQRFQERDVKYIFLQLVLGLHHMHSNKMLHRDIKSSNVLVSTDGLVKIGDFGLSNVYETLNGNIGRTFCGTPYYLPPEQWLKQRYGKAADIWELGVLMYELIELRLPYQGNNPDELRTQVCETQHMPLRYCSADLAIMVNWMLQKDPSKRPNTDQLLRTPLMKELLLSFPSVIRSTTRMQQDLQEVVLRSLDEVNRYVGGAEPSPPVANPTIQFEGVVKKYKEGRLEDRYLVLSEGFLEVLSNASSTRGRARRHVSTLLDIQDVGQFDAFTLLTTEGAQYWFSSPQVKQWVSLIHEAMGTYGGQVAPA